jgi:hypothetical protein
LGGGAKPQGSFLFLVLLPLLVITSLIDRGAMCNLQSYLATEEGHPNINSWQNKATPRRTQTPAPC